MDGASHSIVIDVVSDLTCLGADGAEGVAAHKKVASVLFDDSPTSLIEVYFIL